MHNDHEGHSSRAPAGSYGGIHRGEGSKHEAGHADRNSRRTVEHCSHHGEVETENGNGRAVADGGSPPESSKTLLVLEGVEPQEHLHLRCNGRHFL